MLVKVPPRSSSKERADWHEYDSLPGNVGCLVFILRLAIFNFCLLVTHVYFVLTDVMHISFNFSNGQTTLCWWVCSAMFFDCLLKILRYWNVETQTWHCKHSLVYYHFYVLDNLDVHLCIFCHQKMGNYVAGWGIQNGVFKAKLERRRKCQIFCGRILCL